MRPEISASWRRSGDAGLRPERLSVPYLSDFDDDSLLVRASTPVLKRLSDVLVDSRVGVVLGDNGGHVVGRFTGGQAVRRAFDRISLAPGFVYSETAVGTNAVGTALAEGMPSIVEGDEHFAEALKHMSCAAAPVNDQRSGCMLGVIDLTCELGDANPLMLPLVKVAARQIEDRLQGDTGNRPVSVSWNRLTATEQLVAKLVAEGLSNRETAERLYISHYTVDSHLRSIFRKLSIGSRVELARVVFGGEPRVRQQG